MASSSIDFVTPGTPCFFTSKIFLGGVGHWRDIRSLPFCSTGQPVSKSSSRAKDIIAPWYCGKTRLGNSPTSFNSYLLRDTENDRCQEDERFSLAGQSRVEILGRIMIWSDYLVPMAMENKTVSNPKETGAAAYDDVPE